MKRLSVRWRRVPDDELPLGELAEHDRRVFFEYAPELLATRCEPSPWKLPARAGLLEHTDRAFGPLPGLFDDSLPDGWGLLLMDRHFRRAGLEPAAVSPLDRLAFLGTRTMGALTYHPPSSPREAPIGLDLGELASNARQVLAGTAREVLPALLRAGGSPGGARPKVLVGVRGEELLSGEDELPPGFEPWIVKFSGRSDPRDAGPIELAYARMAAAAGITVPPTRLFEARRGGPYFGVLRFDRGPGGRRLHVHTFGNLIHADFRVPDADYDLLAKVTRALTRDQRAVVEVVRRMAFNVAAHSRDDHVKNFAFTMDDRGEWALAPAYDLCFAHGPGGEHTMTVGGAGVPDGEDCLALAERHGIGRAEARAALEQVDAAVARWPELAHDAGCVRKSIRELGRYHRRVGAG